MPDMQAMNALTAQGSVVQELHESVISELKENSVASNNNGKSIDTGKAAILAYTNIENVQYDENINQVQTDWRKGANTRNGA